MQWGDRGLKTENGEKATDLLGECLSIVENIEKEVKNVRTDGVASSISSTNYALKLHDDLEKHTNELVNLFNCENSNEPECLALKSIRTILPDLVVAAILWVKGSRQQDLLKQIKNNLSELKKSISRIKLVKTLLNKFVHYSRLLATALERLRKSLVRKNKPEKSCCRDRDRDTLLKTREFLSQQIDERSHQIWTLGSLFVPVSFLIFAYAMTIYAVMEQNAVFPLPSSIGKVLLMCASLGCYLVWFMFYLRANRLNALSYPLIHSLELTLGIHGHLSLDQLRLPSRLLRITWPRFLAALYVLATLWILFLRISVGILSIAISMLLSFYVSTWVSLKIDILKNLKRVAASVLVYAALVIMTLLLLPAIISTFVPGLDPALL